MEARAPIPRGEMTPDQRRRIGALQAAKRVLVGEGYNTPAPLTRELLRVARWIETGA